MGSTNGYKCTWHDPRRQSPYEEDILHRNTFSRGIISNGIMPWIAMGVLTRKVRTVCFEWEMVVIASGVNVFLFGTETGWFVHPHVGLHMS